MTTERTDWPYLDMVRVPVDLLGRAQRINRALVTLQAIDACLLREASGNDGQRLQHRFGLGFKLSTTEEYYQGNLSRQFTLVGRPLRTFPTTIELRAGPEAVSFHELDDAKNRPHQVRTSTPGAMLVSGIPSGFEALPSIAQRGFLDQQVRTAIEATMSMY